MLLGKGLRCEYGGDHEDNVINHCHGSLSNALVYFSQNSGVDGIKSSVHQRDWRSRDNQREDHVEVRVDGPGSVTPGVLERVAAGMSCYIVDGHWLTVELVRVSDDEHESRGNCADEVHFFLWETEKSLF